MGEAQSTRTAKFDPTSGSTRAHEWAHESAHESAHEGAHESAHERSFRCFSPSRTPHERPHDTSHEGVRGSAHESVHESGQLSHVLFSHVLFVAQRSPSAIGSAIGRPYPALSRIHTQIGLLNCLVLNHLGSSTARL